MAVPALEPMRREWVQLLRQQGEAWERQRDESYAAMQADAGDLRRERANQPDNIMASAKPG